MLSKKRNYFSQMFLKTKNVLFGYLQKANLTRTCILASVSRFEYVLPFILSMVFLSRGEYRSIVISSLFYLIQKALWLIHVASPLLLLQQQTVNSKKWLLILQTYQVEKGTPTKGEVRKKVAFGLLDLPKYFSKRSSLWQGKGLRIPPYFYRVLNYACCILLP